MDEFFELLKEIHRGGNYGYWWILNGKHSKTIWWPAGSPEEIPDQEPNTNIYFSVHPSKIQNGSYNRAKRDNIAAISCFYSDFDSEPEDLPFPPSATIETSPGHYHFYWLLKEPFTNLQEADRIQKGWVRLVKGDKNSNDLPRVLRVPGTKNYKYSPPTDVILRKFDPSVKYALEVFDALVPKVDKKQHDKQHIDAYELSRIKRALNVLSQDRVDDYGDWITVGMALHDALGDDGLELWEEWSRGSEKFSEGECEYKWETFDSDGGITIATLFSYANEDNPGWGEVKIKVSEKGGEDKATTITEYEKAFRELGYEFRWNDLSKTIWVNGKEITDLDHSKIVMQMLDLGYKSETRIRHAYITLASQRPFNPLQEYLNNLTWDGHDYIRDLSGYFQDDNDIEVTDNISITHQWLHLWLVGAVAKALASDELETAYQNPMLVLDGPQNCGKSYFAAWLCSDIPELFLEEPVNPDDKDDSLRLMSHFIWEVAELGATTRRADVEALKHFITRRTVTVRRPYGKYDIHGLSRASLIGTINNVSGFLNDPTGSRRFLITKLSGIDWSYSTDLLPKDIWAQAVDIYRQFGPPEIDLTTTRLRDNINEGYQVSDPVVDYISKYFYVDPEDKESFTPTIDIVDTIAINTLWRGTTRALEMSINSALNKLGLKKGRRSINQAKLRGYYGIRRRDQPRKNGD